MPSRISISFESLLDLLICAVLAAPFLIFADVPFFDLPAHIAREHVLFDPSLAFTQQFYVPHWRLVPNMAMEAVVFPLHFLMPLDWAIRVFLALTAVQLYLGAAVLNRALVGRDRYFAIGATLFVFNGPFMLGFLNLTFGYGLGLWIFALWIRHGTRPYSWIAFALLSCALLLAHLFAFGIYGLAVGSYTLGLWRQVDWRVMARRLAHLSAPVGFYLFVIPHALTTEAPQMPSLWQRAYAILGVAGATDLLFHVSCLILVLCGYILVRRDLIFSRAMIVPLAALAAAFSVMPHQFGGVAFVNFRIPTVFCLLLAASFGWNGSPRHRRIAEIVMLALFLTRMGVLCGDWAACQPNFQEYRAAFRSMPMGARLLMLGENHEMVDMNEEPPLGHIDALAVTERGAFIPSMFADLPYELITFAPAIDPFDIDPKSYDYVLIVHPDRTARPGGLVDIAHGRDFVLTRVVR